MIADSAVRLLDARAGAPDVESLDLSRPYCLLRPGEVCKRVALSSTHVYRLMGEGRFPRFVPVGRRASGLPEHLLDAFFAERMAARERMPELGFRASLPQWRFDIVRMPARRGIRLVRCRDVAARLGVSRSTLRRLIADGRFPGPVPLGERATRWVENEVSAWVLSAEPPPFDASSGSDARNARVRAT